MTFSRQRFSFHYYCLWTLYFALFSTYTRTWNGVMASFLIKDTLWFEYVQNRILMLSSMIKCQRVLYLLFLFSLTPDLLFDFRFCVHPFFLRHHTLFHIPIHSICYGYNHSLHRVLYLLNNCNVDFKR